MSHPITEARGARTVDWLSAESGVPALTIVRIESGLTEVPMRRTLARLAVALDLDPYDLQVSIAQHLRDRAAAERAAQAASAEGRAAA